MLCIFLTSIKIIFTYILCSMDIFKYLTIFSETFIFFLVSFIINPLTFRLETRSRGKKSLSADSVVLQLVLGNDNFQ